MARQRLILRMVRALFVRLSYVLKRHPWAYLGITICALAAYYALPEYAALRGFLGAGLVILVLFGVIGFYSLGITALKDMASEPGIPIRQPGASATELERNARHIVLREIGGPGQKRLKEARVLVVGAGGLGSPVLQYLAAAGVGTIGVIDDDVVENSNLARQVIHTDDRIGMPKVFSVEQAIKAQNPFVTVRPYHRRLTPEIAADLFADYDLILDGTDDADTRYLVNKTAIAARLPLISGAITQWEGQISLFDPSRGGPCYACVFPEKAADGLAPSCAEGGVLGPLPGVVGTMMAVEAIKHLTGAGETLLGRLFIYDALYGEVRSIQIRKSDSCAYCG